MDHTARRVNPGRLQLLLGAWSEGRDPLYRLLTDRLEQIVTAGLLDDGDRLPSERELARRLSVARGTVVRAYDELARRGRVTRTRGSGTNVRATPRPKRAEATPAATAAFVEPTWSLDLRIARPSMLESVADLLDRPMSVAPLMAGAEASDPAGLPQLRESIADLMTREGLSTSPDHILVTNGAQHGATLLAMQLVDRRAHVAVEEVTWPGFADTVGRIGGRIHRVPMTPTGIDLDALASLQQRVDLSFVALNPHHHNPTGTTMPDRRREELSNLTTRAQTLLVEDRVLARLSFNGRVPLPLAAHAAARQRPDLHVTLDSLTKVAWPGLRIGWLRATRATVQQLRTLRAITDFAPPMQPQLTALAFVDHLDQIVEERTTQLASRWTEIRDALDAAIPDAQIHHATGGIACWIRLPRHSGNHLAAKAATYGLTIPSGSDFGAPDDDQHIRLPLTIDSSELQTALERLQHAWRSLETSALGRAGGGDHQPHLNSHDRACHAGEPAT